MREARPVRRARRATHARRLAWWLLVGAAVVVASVVAEHWLTVAGVFGSIGVLVLFVALVRRTGRCRIVDWRDAERLAARWLDDAGCRRVALTASGADGGIDVLTRAWAVQVKHRSSRTGRPAVQQIVGAAMAVDRQPAVISTSGFTAPAIEFADAHGVALVELDEWGRGHRVNRAAREIGRRRRVAFF